MARKPRIEIADIPYHLIIRGNNRGVIFFDENCYNRYIELLKGCKRRYKYKLYCFCLMPNHVHLILEASQQAPISKIMQSINTSYTLYLNKKFKRTGHVLEGRYKSKIIESNEYLLHLSRYIHMNPIRAKFCRKIEEYEYSSAKYYLSTSTSNNFIDTNFMLGILSDDIKKARMGYKSFLEDGYELYIKEKGFKI